MIDHVDRPARPTSVSITPTATRIQRDPRRGQKNRDDTRRKEDAERERDNKGGRRKGVNIDERC
ncbi:MAG: hypothetical protein V2I82_04830 [Halieaceae bacterium]|nr:hypothetical protein [Halieaceae bacterium]